MMNQNSDNELNVIMPVYNEEEGVTKVLKSWQDKLDSLQINYKIHVYNDGSTDNTLQVLKHYEKQNPRIKIHDKKNEGHGPTILKGYNENTNSEWIFQVDSDNELRIDEFDSLWQKRGDFDFLIGKRVQRINTLQRKVITQIAKNTTWLLLSKKIADVNCPYRLMRTTKVKDFFPKIPHSTFAPNILISGLAGKKNLRIFQTEVVHYPRQMGQTTLVNIRLFKAVIKSMKQTISFALKYS